MEQNKLRFGCAYYREYMPYERLDKDIALMKEAHINYVRIGESTWSTYEKDDGVFDFSSLITVLDKMYENKIDVIIGTPTYAVPSWLCRKYPQILATTPQGVNRYGRRQQMDITHPAYLYYADRIIRKMLEAVASHPAVIGYQLDNETKYYDCVSSNVQIGFVKALKHKYQGDLEKLNRDFGLDYWSNRIDSWEDFPDVTATINGSLYCAFKEYQRSLVTQFLEHQAQIVRPYLKEGQFLTHNFDFEWREQSFGIQPDVNHFQASKALDVMGIDVYHPSQSDLTGAEIAFCGDEARSVKGERYFVLETEAQAFKNWVPYKGQLYLQGMAHIASGASLLGYWHWHSLHNSYETYWKGILSHDFEKNPVYEEVKALGCDLKKIEKPLTGFHKKNRIVLVVSNECLSAIDVFPYHGSSLNTTSFNQHYYNDVIRAYYDALYRLNLECDILSLDDERIFDYQLLVMPLCYSISDDNIGRLRSYVEAGGTILTSFKSFFTDENQKVRTSAQPYGICDLAGISYQLFVEPENVKIESDILRFSETEAVPHDFMELIKVDADDVCVLGRYSHKYWGEYAAITYRQNESGGGVAYIGANIDSGAVEKVMAFLSKKLKLSVLPENLRFPLIVREGINDNGERIVFIMNFSEQEQSLKNPFGQATDLIHDSPVEEDETISLQDYQVKILKIIPKTRA